MKRLLAILAIIVLGGVFIVQCTPKSTFVYDDARPVTWRVGISFPSSTVTLLDLSTVGRWQVILDDLKSELVAHGFEEDNIIVRQTDKRATQVEQIDDLLENEHIDELIVVPVELSKDELIALNGDNSDKWRYEKYQQLKKKSEDMGDATILDGITQIDEPKPYSKSKQDYFDKLKAGIEKRTLTQTLEDAKRANVYTVGIGNDDLNNFPFDYFASTPSPEDIANVESGYAVAHLGLPELGEDGKPPALSDYLETLSAAKVDRDSTENDSSNDVALQFPKNVEVMALDPVRPASKRYFAALLKRMKPYFDFGYLKANSGVIDTKTTADDYIGAAVTEDGDHAAGVMHDILDKHYKRSDANDSAHKLSFIFSESDALSRGAVRACVESGWNPDGDIWPVITGYGAEKITLPDIVETKQSMTIGFASKDLVVGIAQILYNYALSLTQLSTDSTTTSNQKLAESLNAETGTIYLESRQIADYTMPLISARPITIEQENLKAFLIDQGYVQPAEAGL